MKTHLSLCLLLLAVLCACKKDKEEEPAPDRRTLLTSRAWRLNQVLVGTNPITDPSQLALLGPLNGSAIRFNADGTLTATQASGAVTSGTWELGSTQDQLKVTLAGGLVYDFTIKQLDAAQLVLTTLYNYLGVSVPAELRCVPA
jgi:hypothetical protein